MATTYDISITNLKVVVKTTNNNDVSIDTYARDKHKAKLSKSVIRFIKIDSNDTVLNISNIESVSSITDYRDGASDAILIPDNISDLYTDVIESTDTPFFFEITKPDADGPVEVSSNEISEVSSIKSGGLSVLNTEENEDGQQATLLKEIIAELNGIKKVLYKIYN
jgi:hypothetical protein